MQQVRHHPQPILQPLLHVRIVKVTPQGIEEVLTESKPSSGGNHISRIFTEIDELLGLGIEPADLEGAFVETYTDGKFEKRSPLSAVDIQLISDRRARTLK